MDIGFPLILDGAMGTQLQKRGIPSGACPEKWILENPDTVREIQGAYIDAGSQVIYTPTFGANRGALERHGIHGKAAEYNAALAALSIEISGGRALVAGDISSTGGMLYPMGDMEFEDMYEIYAEQAAALEKAGVDLFVIETMTDVAEARAAMLAVRSVSDRPVFVSFSCGENGRTMMGTDVCAALEIMQGMGAAAFGLNCSVGPEEMLPQIRRIYELSEVPVIAKPNAGLPEDVDGRTVFSVDAGKFAGFVPAFIGAGASAVGGCCGTGPDYIAGIKEALSGAAVKAPSPVRKDILPCATSKDVFLLDPSAAYEEVFSCDDELEDNITDLDEGELLAIRIDSEDDVGAFREVRYWINNPLCIVCDDAVLLEKTLREFQGRAIYDGNLGEDELRPLVRKYGLIVR